MTDTTAEISNHLVSQARESEGRGMTDIDTKRLRELMRKIRERNHYYEELTDEECDEIETAFPALLDAADELAKVRAENSTLMASNARLDADLRDYMNLADTHRECIASLTHLHNEVQAENEAYKRQHEAFRRIANTDGATIDRLRSALMYIIKHWPDDFAAAHARAALKEKP
ncbi:MAG: hypothetical protein Q8N51_00610 [Gammaproteobacteria bacterium]|nr:hypothetical protein [Gammaproteobacteria bacterium]